MRIVCVEDDLSLRNVVVDTLHLLAPSATIDVFGNSDDLIVGVNPRELDLVLLDVRIPGGMTGETLAQYLRASGCRGVMALMSAFPRIAPEVLDALSCEWLSKPIDVDTLDGLVMKATLQRPPS